MLLIRGNAVVVATEKKGGKKTFKTVLVTAHLFSLSLLDTVNDT